MIQKETTKEKETELNNERQRYREKQWEKKRQRETTIDKDTERNNERERDREKQW